VRGHVDRQRLAEFREGLLPGRRAARIAAHLRECPRCAEADAQLEAVTAILASTPAPPMPASLAERLDAALAAEIAQSAAAASPAGAVAADGAASAAGAGSPNGAPAPGEGTAHQQGAAAGRGPAGRPPAGSRAPWRPSLRVAAAAAAVVILAGGGYAVVRALSPGTTGESASTSSGSAARSAVGGASASAGPPEAAPAAPGTAVTGGLPVVASGTDYRAGELPAQVGAVLKRYPSPPRSLGHAAAASSFPQLAACASHLTGGRHPQLVDVARYGGRPAAVIVAPTPGTATVRVWVVGQGCTARGGDVIAQFSMPAPG
jgi:Putative zinc-finger